MTIRSDGASGCHRAALCSGPSLRAAVTLFDAFVADDTVKTYRVLGTVVEECGDADAGRRNRLPRWDNGT
jgi:hypothetical protein